MKTFTLTSQARGGFHHAARLVSFRAALPFLGIGSWHDSMTYVGIGLILIVILYLIRTEFRRFRTDDERSQDELSADRHVLEERLAERTKEYVRAESERLAELERTAQFGELSKGLFHDLMNPLTALSLYVEKLRETSAEREIVHKVVAISKRMNSFMESVRHSMGSSLAHKESRANLRQELGIIQDIFGYKAKSAEVTLEISPSPNITLPIHPIRLHQLLSNIVWNAIDACIEDRKNHRPEKEYMVTVDVSDRHSNIEIRVEDNGCGMTEEKRLSLFKKPESTKRDGLGIGLVTVQKILGELGGTISVSSEIEKGSTFLIEIPVHENIRASEV